MLESCHKHWAANSFGFNFSWNEMVFKDYSSRAKREGRVLDCQQLDWETIKVARLSSVSLQGCFTDEWGVEQHLSGKDPPQCKQHRPVGGSSGNRKVVLIGMPPSHSSCSWFTMSWATELHHTPHHPTRLSIIPKSKEAVTTDENP